MNRREKVKRIASDIAKRRKQDLQLLSKPKRAAIYRLAGAIYRQQYEGIPMKKKAHPKPRKGQKAGVAHARKIGGKYYAKVKAGKFSGGTHFVLRPVKAASVKKARAAKRRKK